MAEKNSSGPVLVLPALHLVLCVIVDSTESIGWAGWRLMSLIDFPVFALLALFGISSLTLSAFFVFTVCGTLWWYGVSLAFRFFYRKMVRPE